MFDHLVEVVSEKYDAGVRRIEERLDRIIELLEELRDDIRSR